MANSRHHVRAAASCRWSPTALAVAWAALVAVAVAGRAWQPAPHVTPLAAVAMAAGTLFPSATLAATVPVVALAIGAVAGLRQVAVSRSEQDFEEKLRRLDANRD